MDLFLSGVLFVQQFDPKVFLLRLLATSIYIFLFDNLDQLLFPCEKRHILTIIADI